MSIEVKNIHKSFGNHVALGDINLNFPDGELVALLGPSGCGKTTLLRIIAGLEQADRGQVLLEGQDASNTHVRERQVGFVFQHYALFRHMSVFDNVAFGMRMKPRSERLADAQIRTKVHELLQLVQLDWLADRFPSQLSGGQRQRIALARALAVEPRVLLLDEPFGALDAKVRKDLRRWLRRLHDELHITSIFVTHDQDEALEVADRVVLMDHGKVEQVGTPQEVYRHPATPFVYGFLGASNTFHGRVEGQSIRVGDSLLGHQSFAFDEGSSVVAFARPHELKIIPSNIEMKQGVPATISRILALGVTAHIELTNQDHIHPAHFDVEITHEHLQALSLQEGQTVRLVPSHLKIFKDTHELPATAHHS